MRDKTFNREGYYLSRQGHGIRNRIIKFARKKTIIGKIFTFLRISCYNLNNLVYFRPRRNGWRSTFFRKSFKTTLHHRFWKWKNVHERLGSKLIRHFCAFLLALCSRYSFERKRTKWRTIHKFLFNFHTLRVPMEHFWIQQCLSRERK